MSTTDRDRWRDLMVAALYDEIDDTERAELERALASDPQLHGEWRELGEARQWLAAAARVAEDDEPFEPEAPAGRCGGSRRGWWRPAMVGFAAAASLFLALLAGGLRVDWTPSGMLVRFGAEDPVPAAPTDRQPVGHEVLAAADRGVTEEEFNRFAEMLVGATSARLDELERRQSAARVELVGQLYDALSVTQQRQYDDLRTRLDAAFLQQALSQESGVVGDRR